MNCTYGTGTFAIITTLGNTIPIGNVLGALARVSTPYRVV